MWLHSGLLWQQLKLFDTGLGCSKGAGRQLEVVVREGRERERAWGPSSGRGVWGMSVFLCGQGQCLVGVYDYMIHVHVIVPVYFSLVFSFLVALKC